MRAGGYKIRYSNYPFQVAFAILEKACWYTQET